MCRVIAAGILLLCVFSGGSDSALAQESSEDGAGSVGHFSKDEPVDFKADNLEHDETGRIITATGNVELIQSGRILKADKVTYNLAADVVRAEGNVILSEPTGDTYFGESVELKDKMKEGFVVGLRGMLADGSRFTAKEGDRLAGTRVSMREATYTPCEPCKADPSKPPIWQLVADEVIHHEDEHRISYKNARFELYGVPIAYTPYFSHPDGTVKRKSGLLSPTAGFDSQLGFNYRQDYYWDIAPDKDATIGVMAATDVAPALFGQYRQRFARAEVTGEGSVTYSDRTDRAGQRELVRRDEARGHFSGKARWDMNDKWRSGANVYVASDDQYLRQYNLSHKDVLENEVYAERFDGRDYAVGRMMAFQDVRVSQRQVEQPAVLPEVKAGFVGAPNETLGGRWKAEVSALGLYRNGSDQDVARGTAKVGWQRRFVHSSGLVSTVDMTTRGDVYNIQDRNPDDIAAGVDTGQGAVRTFSQAHLQSSYPLVSRFEGGQAVVEPLVALTGGVKTEDGGYIPNEDSQDFFIDSLKLFNPNRFPGYDRVEDNSRVTYGVRTGAYGDNGYKGEVFLGQSHRFDREGNPFPQGSGLSDQDSDYVGQITMDLGSYFDVDYRFQLDNQDMSSRRHELEARTNVGPVSLWSRYFYANGLRGTDLRNSREQMTSGGRIELTDEWAIQGAVRYDFGEDEGLRKASYGIDYTGQCITLSALAQRSLTRNSSGDSGTEILFRVGLKNLGEFETSAISLGGEDNNE